MVERRFQRLKSRSSEEDFLDDVLVEEVREVEVEPTIVVEDPTMKRRVPDISR